MDGRRFDTFVAALGRTTTRRQWLKTCVAGAFAAAAGGSWLTVRAQNDIEEIQLDSGPLPNFPFLAVASTDSGFAEYAEDHDLTGPPSRYRLLDALPDLSSELRDTLAQGFQSAYVLTISTTSEDDPDSPARSITTTVYDLGSPEAADQGRIDYVNSLFSDTAINQIDSDVDNDSNIVFGGCNGGCGRLSSPASSSTDPDSEMVVVGGHGQFVFDSRIRNFEDNSLDQAEGDSVARLMNRRLTSVTSLTSGASASSSASGGLMKRLSTVFRPARTVMRAVDNGEVLRTALSSRNTLPIFDLGNGETPTSAKQTMVVDDGSIVIRAGETPAQAAARQRSVEDVVYACATEQPLPQDEPYRGGYDLSLITFQYVFGNVGDGEEFLEESRERMNRDRSRIVLTEVSTEEDEIQDVYHDGREDRGYSYGCITHQLLRLGDLAAVLVVEIAAKPRTQNEDPISEEELQEELCPIVDESAEKFVLCILTPDECRSTFPLDLPDGLEPTPTPGPTCNQPSIQCNGQCVDPTEDPNNCGRCNVVCSAAAECIDGNCQCPSGLTDCDGVCADLSTDSGNCGDCGLTCGDNEICSSSECVCFDGRDSCSDVCCGLGMTCDFNECVEACDFELCAETCVDTMTDPNNCGACFETCGSLSCCAGFCTDTGSDTANCGGCGVSCSGSCCGGQCTDTSSDLNNCGGCGSQCGGTCCNGQCTDVSSDPANCGGCGIECPGTQVCYSSNCTDG